MARTLMIELRRSAFAGVGLVLAMAQVALMLMDVGSWRAVWPEASAEVGAHWLFLAPVVAGLSAMERLRRVRRRGSSTGEPVNLLRNEAGVMLAAHASLACLIVLAGCACAVVVNIRAGAPPGFLWPSYLTTTFAFAVESVAIGHLLGSLGGPLWFAPVVAVMITFLRGAWFQGTGVGSPDSSLTRVFLAGHPYISLAPAGLACALLEVGLLLAAALLTPRLLWWAQARRAGRLLPLGSGGTGRALGVALVMSVGLVAVLAGPPLTRYRQPPADPPCTATAMQLCVWPEDASYLPELARIANDGHAVAQQMNVALPSQIGQFGLYPDQQDNFDLLSGSTWSVTSTVADHIAGSLVPLTCTPPAGNNGPLNDYFRAQWEISALIQIKISGETRPAGLGDSTGVDWKEVVGVWRTGPPRESSWVGTRVQAMRMIAQTLCP